MRSKAHLLFKTRTDLAIFLSQISTFFFNSEIQRLGHSKSCFFHKLFSFYWILPEKIAFFTEANCNFVGKFCFYKMWSKSCSKVWVEPLGLAFHHQSSWITECPWLGPRLCSKLYLVFRFLMRETARWNSRFDAK